MEHSENKSRCSYRFRNNEFCREARNNGSEYCFWHDPKADKNVPDLIERLEQRHKNSLPLEGFELARTNLTNIYLIKADLYNVNLKWANLTRAHFFGTNLEKATLFKTHLERANLKQACLKDADLLGAYLDGAEMDSIDWGGEVKLINEKEAEVAKKKGDIKLKQRKYREAEEIYRNIKTNFKNRGLSFEGGAYFYKEMVMKRKQLHKLSFEYLWFILADMTTGYGEKPFKILGFSISMMLVFALLFSVLGIYHFSGRILHFSLSNSLAENCEALYNSLYFSVVTFMTLGYGDYTPIGIGKLAAIFEAFAGPFLVALFVITVYKRFMER